jgi:ParB family chromosome partitioning protein
MNTLPDDNVQMISVERINILNPRDRDKGKFQEIVDSIARVGLKKPITVSRRPAGDCEEHYDLVCGEGRLEAFKRLDQKAIPAIVTELPKEECFLMSLVENLARRHHTPMELMKEIATLSDRGYEPAEIANKTGLSKEYVRDILRLLKSGEERLITAVERNQIPIRIAIAIATTDEEDVQRALTEAYELNELRGNRLLAARRIVQLRRRRGKTFVRSGTPKSGRKLTANAIVRAYKEETQRQRAMVLKADLTEHRLFLIVSALRELFADESFVSLLNASGLDTIPRQIADLISRKEAAE